MARTLSILVLDDNTDNANSLAELLALDDHKVSVVYSGQEAIDAYRATPFDLAFLT
jgi:CheY-like chemotaxis protein